jgi:hypothetical protein
MSTQSATSWTCALFRELGVALVALILASLPFAAAADAQTVANPDAPIWSTLASHSHGVGNRVLNTFDSLRS